MATAVIALDVLPCPKHSEPLTFTAPKAMSYGTLTDT